jgi:hypothetical protein
MNKICLIYGIRVINEEICKSQARYLVTVCFHIQINIFLSASQLFQMKSVNYRFDSNPVALDVQRAVVLFGEGGGGER